MKYLLTSAGIKNPSIHKALVEMLPKPISECSALCITTASYAIPNGVFRAWEFISGSPLTTCPMVELGWKSLGALELLALPNIKREYWLPIVQETDVILVNGGDPIYLTHWMHESGLAELLPSLNAVWVGLSAGSMIMSPNLGEEFIIWTKPEASVGDKALGLVDFAMFPHLDHPMLPTNTMAHAEKWAAKMTIPAYAMDDETAIKVVDGKAEVISEGNWKLFTPS
jgi:dipeptidase E